jgi:hypothetical protein
VRACACIVVAAAAAAAAVGLVVIVVVIVVVVAVVVVVVVVAKCRRLHVRAQALRAAADRGVVIVNVTQCSKGKVEAHYATGTALVEAGVIPGIIIIIIALRYHHPNILLCIYGIIYCVIIIQIYCVTSTGVASNGVIFYAVCVW